VRFQWDPGKARTNLRKHGVDFADAVGAFEDPLALTLNDPHPSEDRYLTLGIDLLGRITVVNWTWRDDEIRVISARKATRPELRSYHEGNDYA
jgi:uncharacterized DUF497 family protein